MLRRRFGRTDLQVPVIGLGTWKVLDVTGAEIEKERHGVVDAALEAGANLIDSSPMYGEAERVVADAIRMRRDEVILATKVWSQHRTLTADQQIERALEFYGDHVDIYQIHNLHDWQEILDKLERLQATGNVGLIGATHYSESAFPELMKIMRTGRIDAIQIPYNLARTRVAEEVLPLAEELGLGVLVMEPLGSGSLVSLDIPEKDLQPLEKFGCTTWSQVLLKWIISDTRVHTAIPATSKPERMRQNAQAGEEPLFGEEERAYVQELYRRYS